MKPIIFLLFFVLSFQSLSVYSQCKGNVVKYTTTSRKAQKCFEKAESLINIKAYKEAEQELLDALAIDDKFIEAYLVLGDIYSMNREFDKSEDVYRKAISISPSFFPESFYLLANNQFNMGKYEEAEKNYRIYLNRNDIYDDNKIKAERALRNCEFAVEAVKHPVDFTPVNVGPAINTELNELYPYLAVDGSSLMFTRNLKDKRTYDGFNEDFYISFKDADGKWLESENMGAPLNSLAYEGAGCLSPDGQTMILAIAPDYLGDYGTGRTGFGGCDLFISKKSGDTWLPPKNLGPNINTPNFESQPSLAPDGRTLYFIRGYRKGYDIVGQDIYSSQYIGNGQWSKAVRLSDKINTPGNEESVFAHPDGQSLYFASDGHPGMGGLDLFVSKKDTNGEWGEPVNLGYPINSVRDEFSIYVSADGKNAYYSSDRAGGFGGLDIYSFGLTEKVRPIPVTYMKGKVLNKDTKQPVSAEFELVDLNSGKTVVRSSSNKVNGEYLVCLPSDKDYALNISKEGYMLFSENFSVKKMTDLKPIVKDVLLMPVKVGEIAVLKNIFFDTDKFELKKESLIELNKLIELLKTNALIKIEISGHTDNRADEKHNLLLSQNRAKAVYDYLIANGIAKERLTFVGYGEKKPIDSNDTEEGRANNRRTEFKIISID